MKNFSRILEANINKCILNNHKKFLIENSITIKYI